MQMALPPRETYTHTAVAVVVEVDEDKETGKRHIMGECIQQNRIQMNGGVSLI